MTNRSGNIRRLGAAVWLAIASLACPDASPDASRESASGTPPAVEVPAPAGSAPAATATGPALSREGVERPEPADPGPDPSVAAREIARASASDAAREPNEVDWSKGDPAHGQALYATHCAICHGGGGAGDGIATPALNPKPRDFRDGRFYLDANANNQTGEDVDLARVILVGPAAFGGTREMVGFRDGLSDQDVRDLIAHLRTLATAVPAGPAGTPAS